MSPGRRHAPPHFPQDRILAEVQARHAAEKAAIETEVDAVLASAAARRDPTLPREPTTTPSSSRPFRRSGKL